MRTRRDLLPPQFHRTLAHFIDIGRDHIGVQQLMAHSIPDALLRFGVADQGGVGAGASPPPVRASPIVFGDDGVIPAAVAALEQAGQEPPGAAGTLGPGTAINRQTGGSRLPQILVHNAQRGHIARYKIIGGVRSGYPLAGFRILAEALPVVEHPAAIEFVVEDSVPAFPAADNGAGAPQPAARGGHTLGVEVAGDDKWAGASGILGKYPADDASLRIVDRAQAPDRLPIIAELADLAVAIGQPARNPAGFDNAALAAPDLLTQLLEEKRGHGAAHADVE